MNRYEVQPVVDFSRLPEFHYLSYHDTLKVIETVQQESGYYQNGFKVTSFSQPEILSV